MKRLSKPIADLRLKWTAAQDTQYRFLPPCALIGMQTDTDTARAAGVKNPLKNWYLFLLTRRTITQLVSFFKDKFDVNAASLIGVARAITS